MLFEPPHNDKSTAWKRRYAMFELAHTLADFGAAVCFIVGSVMFFFELWQTPGTWLFLVGSVLFACKPALRLIREIKMAAHGDIAELAAREKGD